MTWPGDNSPCTIIPHRGSWLPPMQGAMRRFRGRSCEPLSSWGRRGEGSGKVPLLSSDEVTLYESYYRNPLVVNFDWNYLVISCPEAYHAYFHPLNSSRWIKDVYFQGSDTILQDDSRVLVRYKDLPALEARTYMTDSYCLGTFVKCDLWNQRRMLLAYWGDAASPSYMRLQCLKNGYDFSSALCTASQVNNQVAAGIQFVADFGDRHIILDPVKEGKVEMEDLRIRFEIGGAVADLDYPMASEIRLGKEIRVLSREIEIQLTWLHAEFASETVRFEVQRLEDKVWLDMVLYKGEAKIWDLSKLKSMILFGFQIRAGDERRHSNMHEYRYGIEESKAWAAFSANGEEGRVELIS